MNQNEGMIDESNNDESLPCSWSHIEDENLLRKAKFTWKQQPIKTSKGISDRYLPLRRQPKSLKELYLDGV